MADVCKIGLEADGGACRPHHCKRKGPMSADDKPHNLPHCYAGGLVESPDDGSGAVPTDPWQSNQRFRVVSITQLKVAVRPELALDAQSGYSTL